MRDYFFVHINKTGGTSLWKLLGQQPYHRSAQEFILKFGREEWDRRYTFAFTRHPYDRAVSLYHYRHQRTNLGNVHTDNLSFRDFVERAILEQEQPHYNNPFMLGPQVMWLADKANGDIVVQHIFTYERFEENVDLLLKDLGLKRVSPMPREKATRHKPWQDYYQGPEGEEIKHMIDLAWMLDFQYLPYKPKVE
ncbi:MAG: sulfotransferase family 2 domain-containing protein [bacterium]